MRNASAVDAGIIFDMPLLFYVAVGSHVKAIVVDNKRPALQDYVDLLAHAGRQICANAGEIYRKAYRQIWDVETLARQRLFFHQRDSIVKPLNVAPTFYRGIVADNIQHQRFSIRSTIAPWCASTLRI